MPLPAFLEEERLDVRALDLAELQMTEGRQDVPLEALGITPVGAGRQPRGDDGEPPLRICA